MLYRINNDEQYKHALLQNSVKTMSSIVGTGRLGRFLLLVPSKLGPELCSNRAGICSTLPVHAQYCSTSHTTQKMITKLSIVTKSHWHISTHNTAMINPSKHLVKEVFKFTFTYKTSIRCYTD